MEYTEQINNNILNLKIISAINKDDKVCINDNNISIESNDLLQSFRRWYYNQSRLTTMEQLESVINESFKLTDEILDSDDKLNSADTSNIIQRFLIELSSVKKGLDNLKITYNDDVSIVSRIDLLEQRIDVRINRLNNLLVISN